MKLFNFYLPDSMLAKLKTHAALCDLSASQVLRRAITFYLAHEPGHQGTNEKKKNERPAVPCDFAQDPVAQGE